MSSRTSRDARLQVHGTDRRFDLFGDGSLVLLDTKGHTVGHQSLKVRLPKTGTVILTGDAIYTTENENGVAPGLTISLKDPSPRWIG